jgi:DNA-binding NarL/FixJ family response regulator
MWDGVVCAVRASPMLLGSLAAVPEFRVELRDALIRSKDTELARSAGLVTRSTGISGRLSPREREVVDHVRQGKTNSEIAASLVISVGTVKRHLDNAYKKLGAKNRTEAIARYAEIEIAETEPPA